MVPGKREMLERSFYVHIISLLQSPGQAFIYSLNKHAENQLMCQMLGIQKDAKVIPSLLLPSLETQRSLPPGRPPLIVPLF